MTAVYDRATGMMVQQPTGATPAGVTTGANGASLRDTRGRLVSDRMNSLLRDDSDFVQINEKAGQRFAAGRGLLNSSMAAQAGRQAAIAGAQPIAQADAQLMAQADSQNADSINRITEANAAAAVARGQGQGSVNMIDQSAEYAFRREQAALDREQQGLDRALQRDMATDNRAFESLERGLDRGMTREGWEQQQNQAALDRGLTREEWDVRREEANSQRDWQSSENSLGRTHDRDMTTAAGRQAMFSDVMNQSLSTIFSSPDFFNDPAAASGFLEFFTSQFGSLYDRFFGPPGGP